MTSILYFFRNHFIYSLITLFLSPCIIPVVHSQGHLQTFTAQELRHDLEVLRSELKKNHPGLYTYASGNEIRSVFLSIQSSLDRPMTAIEYYKKLVELNEYIKDAHTKILVPKSYNIARNRELVRFPFACHIDSSQLYILKNLSRDSSILPGMKILSINDAPIDSVIHNLMKCVSRDGYNQSRPLRKVSDDFSGYYSLWYGTPEEFHIKLSDNHRNVFEKKVRALKTTEIIERLAKKREVQSHSEPLISFKMKDSVGILTIKSFEGEALKSAGIKYKKVFTNVFELVSTRPVNNLIIDLRNNYGGWPEVADYLLTFLIDTPFCHSMATYAVVDNINSDLYLRDGSVSHFNRQSFRPKKEGVFPLKGIGQVNKPKKRVYTRDVFVLMDGNTSSQAAEFASHLADKTDATFVGTETGGNATQNCGGDIVTLVLPYSGIRVEIPLFSNVLDVKSNKQGRGVIPGYVVQPTAQSKIAGRDLVMEAVLKRIAQKQTQ